jgi:serine protease Do
MLGSRQLGYLFLLFLELGTAALRADSLGSGFILSADGYVLTSNHVIANAVRVVVVPRFEPVDGLVVISDRYKDLALLKIPGKSLVRPA